MVNLNSEAHNLKKTYREIFMQVNEELKQKVERLKPQYLCENCDKNCGIPNDIFEQFPTDCEYRNWQKEVVRYLNNELSKDIYKKWIGVLEHRKNFECLNCGTCCKLACSEFSPEELAFKAKNGDNFAKQFTSIFVPYETQAEARAIFPEYFEMLDEGLDKDEKIYFYHCPKVTKNNMCPDYENRPGICRDFPDNPLGFLPSTCGFKMWKQEVEPTALKLQAVLEIMDFYKEKIPTYK